MELNKKIITKYIICIILVVILIICIFIVNSTYLDVKDNLSSSSTGFSDIRFNYMYRYFEYIKNGKYNKAFEMLTENFKKDKFDNDVNKFAEIMSKDAVTNYNKYDYVSVKYEKDYIIFVDKLDMGTKDIYVYTYEYSPFSYKFEFLFN